MTNKKSNNEPEQQDGFDFIEYPCEFAFKAMAKSKPGIEAQLRILVEEVVSKQNVLSTRLNKSRTGKFESVTITAVLQNRDQLESVYKVLSENPDVIMTL